MIKTPIGIYLITLALTMALISACSEENASEPDAMNNTAVDAGSSDARARDADRRDTGRPDTDGTDAGADGGRPDAETAYPPEGGLFCAAGGESTGGGYTLTHCTSPLEVAGREARGSGYRWQPGAFEAVAPH